ncbi:MAG TPA: hypothetical protein VHL31_14815 [Geminicoccus sp.]|jgi:hypothetical protein|uniref:hypothetical protein n=1 Tax=Geminicoccus sp. TaxID=2024832 RepID=UPI002E375FC4|nr:hypothetical protein [Geminicoccus sp.]HEX2527553.1 hypothetical protein [Geminicoccus sp.]
MTTTCQPTNASLLAVLPSGEAVRASMVRAVLLEELAGLLGEEDVRFRVVVEMEDGSRRVVGTELARTDAMDLARRTGRLINDVIRGS